MENMKQRRLQELKRSDFDIVDGQPDIRGWDVKLANGDRVGKVKELIIDTQQKKVRYMVLDTHKNKLDLEDRRMLIPIGMAQLHSEDDDVVLPGVQVTQLQQLPAYDEERLDGDAERQICSVLGRAGMTQGTQELHSGNTVKKGEKGAAWVEGIQPEPEFYTHDYYNDDNLYRHRLHETQSRSQESDFEKGLRLWERRAEGGIIAGTGSSETGSSRDVHSSSDELSMQRKEAGEGALEPVKKRHNSKIIDTNRSGNRPSSGGGRRNRDHTIEDRIRREGLQDADGRMG
jgi:sporulation protein YlmC with PRC-barrel domain